MGGCRVLACTLVCACGRVGFEAHDGAPGDASTDATAAAGWVGAVVAHWTTSVSTDSFDFAAAAPGDAVVMMVSCDGPATAPSLTVTAPGWSLVALGSLVGSAAAGRWAQSYAAIAPDTLAVSISVTWDVTCVSLVVLGDEFANNDPTLAAFDDHSETEGTGLCSATVTTHRAGDTLWAACDPANGVAATPGFAIGADDQQGDFTEHAVTTDSAGTAETIAYENPTAMNVMVAVAIAHR